MKGQPDTWTGVIKKRGVGATQWLESSLTGWNEELQQSPINYTLDLSNLDFVTLFDWVSTVSLIEKALTKAQTQYFGIDLGVNVALPFLNEGEYITALKAVDQRVRESASFKNSHRVYQLSGFLESLGTSDVLSHGPAGGQIGYPYLTYSKTKLRSFYNGRDGRESIVMGLQRIESKDHCKQYLDQESIGRWRQQMQDKYKSSPLFEYEELWRVFCHELAANVFEHAATAGFLAGRIVEPRGSDGQILDWVASSYPTAILEIIQGGGDGFLELCVCDAGRGLVDTLKETYRKRKKLEAHEHVKPEAVLAFAFDEVGTSKPQNQCWATSRHALGRILMIVAKYGGALRIRSGAADIVYAGTGGKFERIPDHFGYKPQSERRLDSALPGAHFQLILPLSPMAKRVPAPINVLTATLPSGFQPDIRHVQGHLVPLLESLDAPRPVIGNDEFEKFRAACEKLARKLLHKHPPDEPLVIDFSRLEWTAGQFETFLYYLQNLLQTRPALLVEIDPRLANEVATLEDTEAPTQLSELLHFANQIEGDRTLTEIAEKRFLETYRGIHITILGLDSNGKQYIFGLPQRAYETLLLKLSVKPQSFNKLCQSPGVSPNVLGAILNNINPLFTTDSSGAWKTVWDAHAIQREAHRVMTKHFDIVASRCQAWRGRKTDLSDNVLDNKDESRMVFNLPWQDEWRSEFFESARILSRRRHADEIAQRLIYRLEKGLPIIGKSIEGVSVLACVTAPAIMLASAMHRWWPGERPVIADLGPYLLLNPSGVLPVISASGGIVVVQDVLDRGVISRGLITVLRNQGKNVLCTVGFVRLVNAKSSSVTPIEDGWTDPGRLTDEVPTHAMVNIPRPAACDAEKIAELDAYWIEPRTLRPFSYRLLRRETKPRIVNPERVRPRYFAPTQSDIVCTGHFVFGERHYLVAIDVPKALCGSIGWEVSTWLAGICSGEIAEPPTWARPRSKEFEGDVTAVLMPLHSQIQYIWPRVEELLAQRGRRVLSWQLDATLFLGFGPAYRLPHQLDKLIRDAAREVYRARVEGRAERDVRLRLLILDDAIVSARTVETILAEIDRVVDKANEFLVSNYGERIERVEPIEWIRCFVVFGLMGHARHQHWLDIRRIGVGAGIPFVYEEYCWISGVPSFDERSCPTCAKLRRLVHLRETASAMELVELEDWADRAMEQVRPIALDTPGFAGTTQDRLPRSIRLLPDGTGEWGQDILVAWTAEEAILRFFEVTYLSYPPKDVINALLQGNATPNSDDARSVVIAYERYRAVVLGWYLWNWPRLVADTARREFLAQVDSEIELQSGLVVDVFEGLAQNYHDAEVVQFVLRSLERLAELEVKRAEVRDKSQGARRIILYQALLVYLASMPSDALTCLQIEDGRHINFLGHMEQLARRFGDEITFIRNLYLKFMQPRRHADPSWALRTLAETVFRGRNPMDPVLGGHRLLPYLLGKLIGGIATEEIVCLLVSGLSLFRAALDEFRAFCAEHALPQERIAQLSDEALQWLVGTKEIEDLRHPPQSVVGLYDSLTLDGEFCIAFDRLFRVPVENVMRMLEDAYHTVKAENKLEFAFEIKPDVAGWRLLAPVDKVCNFLQNRAINPVGELPSGEVRRRRSRISVSRRVVATGTDQLCFRLVTDFGPPERAERDTTHGRNHDYEVITLRMFGVAIPEAWLAPSVEEAEEGFEAAYEFFVPVGLIPRNQTIE
jgi:hypothetical protein